MLSTEPVARGLDAKESGQLTRRSQLTTMHIFVSQKHVRRLPMGVASPWALLGRSECQSVRKLAQDHTQARPHSHCHPSHRDCWPCQRPCHWRAP
eukprot:15465682-Alexandrium_andersonii.AAC.1